MSIPLPDLLRHLREDEYAQHVTPARQRWALRLWAWLVLHPRLYRSVTTLASRLLATLGRDGVLPRLPLLRGWQQGRDFPAPPGGSFVRAWQQGKDGQHE